MHKLSERINVLVTPAEKEEIIQMAAQKGLSTGAFMRQAVFSSNSLDEENALEHILDRFNIEMKRQGN